MKAKSLILIFLFLITLVDLNQCAIRPLNNDWVFRIDDGVYPAFVPSTTIDILIKNGILPSDFYYRDNFLRAYKYETKDSIYSLAFFVT